MLLLFGHPEATRLLAIYLFPFIPWFRVIVLWSSSVGLPPVAFGPGTGEVTREGRPLAQVVPRSRLALPRIS